MHLRIYKISSSEILSKHVFLRSAYAYKATYIKVTQMLDCSISQLHHSMPKITIAIDTCHRLCLGLVSITEFSYTCCDATTYVRVDDYEMIRNMLVEEPAIHNLILRDLW